MSRDQKRATFRNFNIHVKNNAPSKQHSVLEQGNTRTEDRLNDIVDLLYPRDAHGTIPFDYSLFLLPLTLTFIT